MSWSRREMLSAAGAALAVGSMARAQPPAAPASLTLSLNTSTIRGQNLGIVKEIEIAAKAGFQAIEPWINELDKYRESGGSLADLGKRIADAGLKVESAIGFAAWIVDDAAQRAKGLEEAKRCMDMVRRIGGKRLAAPPVGATESDSIPLLRIAERYRALLELGDRMEVVPQVEMWGFSKTLRRLSEVAMVAVETGHPRACVLPDVYHFYKGGSAFGGLKLLGAASMHVFHLNDYPADPPPASINDSHRVFPGDGVAPLKDILRDLVAVGFRGTLSLELFNRDYWKQDPLQVATTGREKMQALIRSL